MSNLELAPGLKGTSRTVVLKKDLAHEYGNPGVEVYATPALSGLLEAACVHTVAGRFDEQTHITVGSRMEMDHLKPTPEGFTVTAEAELMEVKGPKLVFQVTAHDGVEPVARGVHTRYLVDKEKFFDNVRKKAAGSR